MVHTTIVFFLACTSTDDADLPKDPPPDDEEIQLEPFAVEPMWQSTEWGYATGGVTVDIDNDGDQDIVIAEGNDMNPGKLRVYYNQDGSIEQEASWSSTEEHYFAHLSAGDVNGDGWLDVVASRFLGDSGFSEPGGVSLYLNDGGLLTDDPSWSFDGVYSFSNALGDVDADGDLDLAVAVGESYYHAPDHSLLFENQDGDFGDTAIWQMAEPSYAFDCRFVDADADGDLDLVFANQQTGHQLYENLSGQLSDIPMWESEGIETEGNSLDIGDVNADGFVDFLISDNNQLGGIGQVSLFCGPSFELCWQSEDTPRMQSAVSIHDVDLDGDLDIVSGAWWGDVKWYKQTDGILETTASWSNDNYQQVIEVFAWIDADQSHQITEQLMVEGLYFLPENAVVYGNVEWRSNQYIFAENETEIEIRYSIAPDLLITDWEPEQGNTLLQRLIIDN